MNAIMAWYAGYESGVCTAPGESRVKNVRGIAEFAPERVAKSTIIHRAETSSVKAENQVKSIRSSARWLGNCRRSQSQGMDAGEVSHRVRMDELRPVVP